MSLRTISARVKQQKMLILEESKPCNTETEEMRTAQTLAFGLSVSFLFHVCMPSSYKQTEISAIRKIIL